MSNSTISSAHFSHSQGTALPSSVLKELLNKQPYQGMWSQFVQRRRGNSINVRAVATYMAYELSDSLGYEVSPDYLKDSVRRAINGGQITDRTINKFIAAFGFTDEEQAELWRAVLSLKVQDFVEVPSGYEAGEKQNRENNRTTLSQTIITTVDEMGLIQDIEITEYFRVERVPLQYFQPILEGADLELELLEGGEITQVSEDSGLYNFVNRNNLVYGIYVKTPYVLQPGEVHRYRLMVHINEKYDESVPYNVFRVGAEAGPKYHVTSMIRFAGTFSNVRHCIWDTPNDSKPLIEEIMPQELTHCSANYPILYKAYYGFKWPVRPPQRIAMESE